jgi:hypothetical protein
MRPVKEGIMSEHTSDNQQVRAGDTAPEDVEGHYLPLDDDGKVDLTPRLDDTEDDVEGHSAADGDLDFERKR